MDNRFRFTLEELADSQALENEKQVIQEALAEQGSRMARLHWALVRDTARSGLKKCLSEIDPVHFDKAYFLGAAKAEDADVIVEVRSGAVGTDQSETYVGIPEIAVPGPLPVAIPQVKFWSKSTQTGTAKIGISTRG